MIHPSTEEIDSLENESSLNTFEVCLGYGIDRLPCQSSRSEVRTVILHGSFLVSADQLGNGYPALNCIPSSCIMSWYYPVNTSEFLEIYFSHHQLVSSNDGDH